MKKEQDSTIGKESKKEMGKMTERELRKLRRTELLEILLELRRELDAARQENESLREQLNAAEQERQEKTDAILELLHTMEAQLERMCPAQADAEASMQDDEAK